MRRQKRRRGVAVLRNAGTGFLGFEKRRVEKMMYKCGRLLQLIGLIVLPLAIAGNLAPEPQGINLRTSLTMSTIGVIAFMLGYLLQQMGRK